MFSISCCAAVIGVNRPMALTSIIVPASRESAVLDRCILRMGVWELRFNPEVPDAVAIEKASAVCPASPRAAASVSVFARLAQ